MTFTPDELKALDLESSKVIDLGTFVPRGEVDPVYLNSSITSILMARWPSGRSG